MSNNDNKPKYPFLGMVFEGGGPSGVGHIGALEVFQEKGILPNIKYFVGSSVGAIAATALAVRTDMKTLRDILFSTDFNQFKDDSNCFCRDINRFIREYGWYKADRLYEWFGEILQDITGNKDITFDEVYRIYGNYLAVTITDVNLGQTLYLNHLNSPQMTVRLAVKRSSMMPLFFKADSETKLTPVISDGEVVEKNILHYYTDGGLLNNYPIHHLDDVLTPEQIVGFKLMSTKELHEINNSHLSSNSKPPKHVIDYIMLLYTILRNQALKVHINEDDWKRTVKIDVGNISSTDFDLTDTEKYFLIDQGKTAAINFLANFEI